MGMAQLELELHSIIIIAILFNLYDYISKVSSEMIIVSMVQLRLHFKCRGIIDAQIKKHRC